MSPRARRQVLAQLTLAEREALSDQPLPDLPQATPETEPGAVSPWLAFAIADARTSRTGLVSPAARAALIECADAVRRPDERVTERSSREPGRSLVEAFGGLLPIRKGR